MLTGSSAETPGSASVSAGSCELQPVLQLGSQPQTASAAETRLADCQDVGLLQEAVATLEKEKAELRARLDFVEELVGPTETQRKEFQQQITAARGAALRAKRCGAPIPTRFVGRLDERWLRLRGLSERDCALLQRGCITGQDGVPKDISLLGDPNFCPYNEQTLAPRWEARGGSLRLSLGDVRDRWGEEVALEVVRCAIELDRFDASRRIGLELPWYAIENRELQAAEIIHLLERELSARDAADEVRSLDLHSDEGQSEDGVTPALSVMESVISDGGTASSASPLLDVTGCADDDYEQEHYEWSLADADIEQLLQAGKAGNGPRSLLGMPAQNAMQAQAQAQATSAASAEPLDEEEEEALLELLEEEVAGSLSLLTPTPPPGLSSTL